MKTHAYFMSNFETPNLLIRGGAGQYDLTATFANIEQHFGSKTLCSEEEAKARRAQKEQLKLICVAYAIMGPQEGTEHLDEKAEVWLLPVYPWHREDCYKAFTPKDCVGKPA